MAPEWFEQKEEGKCLLGTNCMCRSTLVTPYMLHHISVVSVTSHMSYDMELDCLSVSQENMAYKKTYLMQ